MNRVSSYNIKLCKVVSGGHRNIDSYYLVIRNDRQPIKLISKAMRIDEDNEDYVSG